MTYLDDYKICGVIDPRLWAKDHLTTLLFLEAHLTDLGVFWARPNERMRTHPSTFGQEVEVSPNSRRRDIPCGDAPTKLVDGLEVPEHDDWSCLWDMGALGLLSYHPEQERTGGRYFQIKLTSTGDELAAELRRNRRAGLRKIYDTPRTTSAWIRLTDTYRLLLEGAPRLRGPDKAKLIYTEEGQLCPASRWSGVNGMPCPWNRPISFYTPEEEPAHLFPDMIAQRWPETPLDVMV